MTSELRRILHVDDDKSIRDVTRVALVAVGGFELLSCESGAEALDKAPAFDPQLVLLDVTMPDMDGPTTLAKLQERMQFSDRMVLFFTAKIMPPEADYYRALGAQDVLVKPFNPMTISDQLRELWKSFQAERSKKALIMDILANPARSNTD